MGWVGVDVCVVGLLMLWVGGVCVGRRVGLVGAVGVAVAAAECRSFGSSTYWCWLENMWRGIAKE